MRVIAENGKRIMIVADDITFSPHDIDERIQCRVYNIDTDELAPEFPIGSWTARIFPWYAPSRDYSKELERVASIVEKEG